MSPSSVIIAAVPALVVVFLALLSLCFCYYCCPNNEEEDERILDQNSDQRITPTSPSVSITPNPPRILSVQIVDPNMPSTSHNPPFVHPSYIFTREELEKATRGFVEKLGEGGFGPVFKGVLPSGALVAVKMLKVGSKQGDREFQNEIHTIGLVYHRNLVPLIGYCIDGSERFLVYPFVPNGSLKSHLYGINIGKILSWRHRMKIAVGSAKALRFLHEHEPPIVHRDFKDENILLNDDFDPMLGDFGLAKIFQDNASYVRTQPKWSFGYVEPEYAKTGILTTKSDVFSFGVVLLEMITGRPCIQMGEHISDWAKPRLREIQGSGNPHSLVDPALENNYDRQEMLRMIYCATSCVYKSSKRRPTIRQVIEVLNGDLGWENIWNWNADMPPSGDSSSSSSGSYSDALEYFLDHGQQSCLPRIEE